MKECICKKWEENSETLSGMQIFCMNQSGSPNWDVEVFRFCPWCGHLLKGK